MENKVRTLNNISLQQVGGKIWMEYYVAGIQLRIEMNQQEIDALAKLAQEMSLGLHEYFLNKIA